MVIWGAIWGGVLGLLWPGHDWEVQLFAGAILGALAGLMLRRAVRKEVLAQQAKAPTGAAVKAAAPAAAATAAAAAAATPVATSLPATAMPAAAEAVPPATAAEPGQAAPPVAAITTPATPATPQAPVRPKPAPAPASPDMVTVLFEKARAWLFGGNTVVRMGVLVLFVGLAFLAKYAIENSLLPPELRLAAIGAAGIALFVVGFRLRGKSPDKLAYALTLQGAGVAVLYLTVFAAFRLYQFLPAGAAFAAAGRALRNSSAMIWRVVSSDCCLAATRAVVRIVSSIAAPPVAIVHTCFRLTRHPHNQRVRNSTR